MTAYQPPKTCLIRPEWDSALSTAIKSYPHSSINQTNADSFAGDAVGLAWEIYLHSEEKQP